MSTSFAHRRFKFESWPCIVSQVLLGVTPYNILGVVSRNYLVCLPKSNQSKTKAKILKALKNKNPLRVMKPIVH